MQSSWCDIISWSVCFLLVNTCKLIFAAVHKQKQNYSISLSWHNLTGCQNTKFRYSVIDKSQVVWLDLCCPPPCNVSYLFGLFSPSPPAWWDNLDTRWTHLSSSWLQPFIVISMTIRKSSFCPRWLLPGSWLHCPRPLSPSACQGAPILHCQSQC